MCFDHFMLWATCQAGSAVCVRYSGFLCYFLLVNSYTELEGLGYVRPRGLGCASDAGARCAGLSAPEFLGMSICALERTPSSSLLRGELHAGMAQG